MNEEALTVFAVSGAVMLTVLVFAFSVATPGIILDRQRYATYLEAQRTIVDCRIKTSGRDPDEICGPIPTLDSFVSNQ